MTITFIESRYPEKLLEHLKNERKYTVEQTGPGIYTISGDILPLQIIDSRLLPVEENLWLKSLSNRLDITALSKISGEIYRQGKAVRISAYLDVIVRANAQTLREVIQMGDALTIEQVFEEVGWVAKREARGEARGESQKALKIAKNMIALGLPFETVVSATQLDPEKVKALYQ